MTFFGLNSPEIFILLVIFLLILGPKRIEKLLNSFPGFIKFLLTDEKNHKNVTEEKAPVIEETEEKAPVIEETEVKAPVDAEKELEGSKNKDKVTKTMNAKSINLDGENKVNRKRSVKTKEKTPKSNKKTQTKKDKDPDNIK